MARRKRRSGGHTGLIVFLIIVLALLAAVIAGLVWVNSDIKGSRGTVKEATVIIEKGSGPLTIGRELESAGIIKNAQIFRLYVKKQQVADSLQYGQFTLSSDMSYDAIIQALQKTTDDRDTVRVTFPEGITATQFAKRMEEAGLCSADDFLNAANTGDYSQFQFWAKRDENANQFMPSEGYLFPDTYDFFVGDDVSNMVAKIYGQFDTNFTDEMYQKVSDMGFTLSQFMTLASIVQEEAGSAEHQADVAAVFMNRLAPDSPVTLLQSNCSSYIQNENDNNYLYNTVAPYYGGWDSIPAEIVTAYDTYTTPGLPAGPISNPGMEAITNTLNYAQSQYYGTGYYYFVTDTDGNYYFNKTADVHEAQCDKLRAAGKMAG